MSSESSTLPPASSDAPGTARDPASPRTDVSEVLPPVPAGSDQPIVEVAAQVDCPPSVSPSTRASPRLSKQTEAGLTVTPTTRRPTLKGKAAKSASTGAKAAGKKKRKARAVPSPPPSPLATAPALKKSKTASTLAIRPTNQPAQPASSNPAVTTDEQPAHIDLSLDEDALPADNIQSSLMEVLRDERRGFNLDEFLSDFNATEPAGTAVVEPVAPVEASVQSQLASLQALVLDMRARLDAAPSAPSLADDARPVSSPAINASASWTLPAGRSATLPPQQLVELRASSFAVPVRRNKGKYQPTPAHLLTAHRTFRWLATAEGRAASPMSYLLMFREMRSVRFPTPPAVLMAIFSGQLGSRGLTVMHFRRLSERQLLELGSSNANYNADFSAGAALPRTTLQCEHYEHLIDAIQGLADFGHGVWYEHVQALTSRLRQFVLDNYAVDQCNSPARVTLTLLFTNRFMGTALGHLMDDSPFWWRNYHRALQAIEFNSIEWSMALNNLALQAPRTDRTTVPPNQSRAPDHRRHATQCATGVRSASATNATSYPPTNPAQRQCP